MHARSSCEVLCRVKECDDATEEERKVKWLQHLHTRLRRVKKKLEVYPDICDLTSLLQVAFTTTGFSCKNLSKLFGDAAAAGRCAIHTLYK
jgi:hypothetical protein